MGACYEVISAFAGKLHVAVPLKRRWVQTSANRVSLGMCQSFAVGASLIYAVKRGHFEDLVRLLLASAQAP
jgi:hypothetical protein